MKNGAIAVALSIVLVLAFGASSAPATTTHPFVKNITITGNPQPEAVDDAGNLLVWLPSQRAIGKFDTNGNPVNFSGLGTNILDGKGELNCPSVLADCDRVPTNGFMAGTGSEGNDAYRAFDVDHTGGPADGYIYVSNNDHAVTCQCGTRGEVDVFDSSGVYIGSIDQSQTTPDVLGNESSTLFIASDGVIYIDHWAFGGNSHVDRYVPIDDEPIHDQFSGQIRIGFGSYEGVAAGPTYVYTIGFDATHAPPTDRVHYGRYPQAEFHRQGFENKSVSETFPPDLAPFGPRGGIWAPCNCGLPVIYVDPLNEHAFVGGSYGAGLAEFDPQNHQVGPAFGVDQIESTQAMVIDRSGGPNDGDIYSHGTGSNKIAVFGPPAPIPDIENIEAEGHHTTADINADINLSGGPAATECKIQYGPKPQSFTQAGFVDYESVIPCSPATPYGSNQEVHADLSGLEPEVLYHYRFVVKNVNGQNATEDHTFPTHAVLSVSTDPATNLTEGSADLNGSLDPDGLQTDYRFEYGISIHYNNKTPQVSAGSGSGVQPVAPASISGLQSGRVYHYRIVAKNSIGKTRAPDQTFTVPAPPGISGVRATNLTDTSADINAQVDSLTYGTTAFFEYGTSPSYGETTPEQDVGSEAGPKPIFAHIENLEPGPIYHYRVVATNKWGTRKSADSTFSFQAPGCPNAHVRQQTNASYLPDCRAYELVSPGVAGGVTFFPGSVVKEPGGEFSSVAEILGITAPNIAGLASSPARFGYFGGEGSILGLHPPNALLDRYVATRRATGWVTTYPGIGGDEGLLVENPSCNRALSLCVDSRGPNPLSGGEEAPPTGRYLWDVSGKFLGRLPTNIGVVPNGDHFIGEAKLSSDFSHFVFSSRNVAFAPGGLEAAPGSVYDNDIANETVTLISKLPNGDPIPQEVPRADEHIKIPAVSDNGSHILMTTESETGKQNIYMSIDDAAAITIGEGTLAGMTADGTKVAFASANRMVPEDTDFSVDMYMWEESTGKVKILSQGNGNGDSDFCGAFFTERCDVQVLKTERPDLDNAMAEESGGVYFYSPEQLDPSNPGVVNERNLYVYRNGHPQYVTTLDPETKVDRIQVSPAGDHMAFLSRTQATGYVNVSPDDGTAGDTHAPEAWQEMYTYDPATGEILCASCIPSGEPPRVFSADIGRSIDSNKDVKASMSGRFMTNNGRVAFTTADSLVPSDTNEKLDVYEFSGNRPQLISSGTGERDTLGGALFYPASHTGFESFSQDGTDLYFSTFETFVPEDENGTFVKFYDARSNGGFPIQPPELPCTAADECHGDSTSSPAEPSTATGNGLGTGGNLKSGGRGRHGKGKVKGKGRHKRHKKHRKHSGQRTGRSHG